MDLSNPFLVFILVALLLSDLAFPKRKSAIITNSLSRLWKTVLGSFCRKGNGVHNGDVNYVDEGDATVEIGDSPGKPTNVIVDDWDTDRIWVRWTEPRYEGIGPIIAYDIQRLKVPDNVWTTIATVDRYTLDYEVGILDKYSTYKFCIVAKNEFAVGEPSHPAEIVTVSSAFDTPSEPTNFMFVEWNENYVRLKWQKPNYVGGQPLTGYFVEYKSIYEISWIRAITIYGARRDIRITGVPYGRIQFRVTAQNKIGFGKPSEVLTINIEMSYSKPSQPLNLVIAETDHDYVVLRWERPENENGAPITRYVIEYKKNVRNLWFKVGLVNADTTTQKLNNLSDDIVYNFRVKAINKAGRGDASNVVDVIIKSPTASTSESPGTVKNQDQKNKENPSSDNKSDVAEKTSVSSESGQFSDRPSKPRNVKIYDWGRHYVYLVWTKPVHDGGSPIIKYEIEVRTSTSKEWENCKFVDGQALTTKISDLKKIKGQFRIIAWNESGRGEPSDSTEMITTRFSIRNSIQHKILPLIGKPGPPTNLQLLENKKDIVKLSWDSPGGTLFGGEILGYQTEFKYTHEIFWMSMKKIYGDVSSATIPNIQGGFYYYLRIRAFNKAGFGEASLPIKNVVAFAKPRSMSENPTDVSKFSFGGSKVPTIDNSLDEDHEEGEIRKFYEDLEPVEEVSDYSTLTSITSPMQIATVVAIRYPEHETILYKLGEHVHIINKDLKSLIVYKTVSSSLYSYVTGEWLTDGVVSGYLYTLSDQYSHFSYLETNYSQMIFGEYTEQYLESYLMPELNVRDKTHYVVPINRGSHWIIMIIRLQLKKYAILGGHVSYKEEERVNIFTRFLLKKMNRPSETGMKRVTKESKISNDGYNCGVIVCWHAKQFALYRDFSDNRFSPNQFRVEIFNAITNEKWKVFRKKI